MSLCVCSSCSSNCVPSPIRQGERVAWDWTFCDYPATEYTLQVRFRGPGTGKDVTATADGSGYNVVLTVNAPTTFNVAGTYSWQAWLTEIATPTNTFVGQQGTIEIRTGFVAAETGDVDLRTPAQIALDSIDAAMAAFATSDVMEYEITTPAGSRRVKRSAREDLINLRKHYAMTVSLERTRDRLRNGGTLLKSVPISMREC